MARAGTMERATQGRAGPVCGLGFVAAYAALFALLAGVDPGLRPGDDPEVIAAATGELLGGAAEPVLFAFGASTLLFVVFLADLHQRVRRAVGDDGGWLATTMLAGGILLVVAYLVTLVVWIGQGVAVHYEAPDPVVVATLYTLAWNSLAVSIPGILAMTGAAAVASLRYRALPTWLGGLAVLAFVAGFVTYWVPVWLLWVLATASTLLVRRSESRERVQVPA